MATGADKEPQGQVGEFGYEEFDSKDFEEDAPEPKEKTDDKPAGEPAAGQGAADSKGAKDEKIVDDAAVETEDDEFKAGDEIGDEGSDSKVTEEKAGDEKPAYEPDLKYRVYDQDKEFPDWVKPLVVDKASEDQFRDLFSKAEALEPMKQIHQKIVQDRDVQKGRADALYGNADRIMRLRDTNHRLFFRELGVPDEMLVRAGREIIEARDPDADPAVRQNFTNMREQEWNAHQSALNAQNANAQLAQQSANAFNQAFDNAIAAPHVASFAQRFDAMKGKSGAFADVVRAHGIYVFESTKTPQGGGTVLAPHEAVQQMMDFHSKGMPQGEQQQTKPAAAAGAKPGQQQQTPPGTVRERPRSLVTTPRGRNASPIGDGRPKNLKAMKEAFKRELSRGG